MNLSAIVSECHNAIETCMNPKLAENTKQADRQTYDKSVKQKSSDHKCFVVDNSQP
jgi:hypothetical protein